VKAISLYFAVRMSPVRTDRPPNAELKLTALNGCGWLATLACRNFQSAAAKLGR
jgi:hypothetical protein